jgi:hypothetical protein
MENEQVPVLESTPTTTLPITPIVSTSPVVQPSIVIPPTKRSNLPVIVMTILFFVALLGMMILFLQNNTLRQQNPTIGQAPSISPTATPMLTATPAPTAPGIVWKKYVSPTKVEISYPEDWVLKASTDSVWLKEEGPAITLTQGANKITIDFPTDFGPGLCIFKDEAAFADDPSQSEMMAGSKCPGDFVEIKGLGGAMRRLVKPNPTMENNGITIWSIYTKDNEGYFVGNPPILYKVPDDFDSKTITMMDQIISTLKTVK